MTLKQLVDIYLTEGYDFFKYTNSDGQDINVRFLFETHADYLDKYLSFYKELPNLTDVIVFASDGIFQLTNQGVQHFIRHNHQETFIGRDGKERGIDFAISKQVKHNLIKRVDDIRNAKNFHDIFEIVSGCKINGFGELAIYDTSVRIATKFNIEPSEVFMHAGSRAGFEILEQKGYLEKGISKSRCVGLANLPKELQVLKAIEIEHFACAKKNDMKYLDAIVP